MVAVGELLQDVLRPGRSHSYVQHEVDARYAAELGLPQLGDQLPGGGKGDAHGLRVNHDAHGQMCSGRGPPQRGGYLGAEGGQIGGQ